MVDRSADTPEARLAADSVRTSGADQALKHVYRGFDFGPDIDWLTIRRTLRSRVRQGMVDGFLRMPWWDDLGEAYWATGEEKYAQEFVRQFRDFAAKHPIPVRRSGGSTSAEVCRARVADAGDRDPAEQFLDERILSFLPRRRWTTRPFARCSSRSGRWDIIWRIIRV